MTHATPARRVKRGRHATASGRAPVRAARKPAPVNRTWLRLATRAPGRTHADTGGRIAGETAARIESLRGGGQPLPPSTRASFESRLGRDLGDVRVHTGDAPASLSERLSARAFTYGSDVFFGAGQYQPESRGGRHLLAHELTHVVQQSPDARRGLVQRYESGKYSYEHTRACPDDFIKTYVWPGHNLAFRMVKHALYGLCAARYGNRTARNKEARVQVKTIFGDDWKAKSPEVYGTLWKIRSSLVNKFKYDCDTTGYVFCEWDPPTNTEWAYTGIGSSTTTLCHENLSRSDRAKFAQVAIHEAGHRMGLGHGADDESESCNGETDDAHCIALLAEGMWANVDPNYAENNGDLCYAPGPTEAEQWD